MLVVDDNLDAAESLAMLLQIDGHETALAHDGQRALELAQSFGPEVILLDIGLPLLNGYEVAQADARAALGPADQADRGDRLGPGAGSPARRWPPASTTT